MKFITSYLASLPLLLAATLGSESVLAIDLPATLYGKINISYDMVKDAENNWASNASRLGVKGSYELDTDLAVVYQLEQEVDYAHGRNNINTLFSMRNSFVGVKGNFGTVFFGINDTPFKLAQNKVDVFNDQIGDIKNIVVDEIRAADSWFYHSPKLASGFALQAAYVPADSVFSSSQSVFVSYDIGDLFLGLGLDSDMRRNDRSVSSTKVYDSVRGVVQYKLESWQFGLLLQSSERQKVAAADKEFSYSFSVTKEIEDLTFKVQHGNSDIVVEDLRSTLVGVDYDVAKNTKVYAYYWDYNIGEHANVISVGFEYKF
jgi:predicted porin